MELESIESSWYADGLEAALRLRFRGYESDGRYLVEILRPCCEKFIHAPQRPQPDGALTCIIPRESFEHSEAVSVSVRGERGDGQTELLWEAQLLAREVDGEPRVEVIEKGLSETAAA